MARPCRLKAENCFYHIMSRGDDRKRIFLKEGDYTKFLSYVVTAKDKFRFHLYAYVLMPNHYHLLLETTLPNISRIMQYVNGSFTTYYNTKYRRCGHVFQGRFKSIVVEKDRYFVELSRYIHLNPVRAKLTMSPEEYTWSSYQAYVGGRHEYVDREHFGDYLGMDNRQYRRFVLEGMNKELNPLADVYAGFILGSTRFIKEKLRHLGDQITSDEVAYREELKQSTCAEELIMNAVARQYKISLDDLCNSRSRPMRAK